MPTSIGEFREMLIDAIAAVRRGDLDPTDADAMAKLASQVTNSLQVEANIRKYEMALRRDGTIEVIGELPLGEVRKSAPDHRSQTAIMTDPLEWCSRRPVRWTAIGVLIIALALAYATNSPWPNL